MANMRNYLLRFICRAYPFNKGRYRFMKFCEMLLDQEEVIITIYGKYKFALNLLERGLQRDFYFFIPELYELETQRFIIENISTGMTTIDIGAHCGLLTILLAHRTGSKGKVYCFEPASNNFVRLKKNIDLNNLVWVYPLQMAVSDTTGSCNLNLSVDSSGHFLSQKHEDSKSEALNQVVSTISLDHFCDEQDIKQINLLKIDAERSEKLILQGAQGLLRKGAIERIICEIHTSMDTSELEEDQVRKILYSYGYRSFSLNQMLSGKKYLSEIFPDEPVAGLQNMLFQRVSPHAR
jgi:FkbM family methyltransferase